jgi:uncharacterized protein YbjT (DUF2867 family)
MQTLMLVGASGLVGGEVLQQALASDEVARVVAPTRRPLPEHPKLINPQVSFHRLPEGANWWAVDAVICTLGTTMAKAGDRAAFYAVDHDIPLLVAKLALAHGARAFALNSALGADLNSRVFYSRTKGELERDLLALGYPSLTFVRPGLIGGDRQESRPAEQIGVRLSQLLKPLLPRRYRVVPAEQIARQLLRSALVAQGGVRVVMSEDMGVNLV